jgi:leader peptidase (prepilin peptidase) / N-methyltransferase
MFLLTVLLLFVWGAVMGSFLNVVILRLPREETLGGRSHCMHCKHELSSWDLIPVASFMVLGGKCRYCRGKISPRYAVIEVVTGLLFAAIWAAMAPDAPVEYLAFARAAVFLASLVVIFTIDLEHFLILDTVLITTGLFLIAGNFALDAYSGSQWWSIYSYTAGGVLAGIAASAPLFLLWIISKGRWIGFGDVKFMLVLGLASGWPEIWVTWFLAFFLGAFVSVFLMATGKYHLGSRLPFGTFLCIAAIFTLVWGEKIAKWYLSLLGI